MSSRHRRRARENGAGTKKKLPKVTLSVTGTLIPSSPMMQRPGLDSEVILAIQDLDALINDMRKGLEYPSAPEDEESSVKRYLLYVSMLVDCVLPDIIMSAIAEHDVMVQIKQRILLEHSVKAIYYDEHPDYALYMMTVCEAESIVRKLSKAKSPPDRIAAAQKHADEMRAKFPVPAKMAEKSFEMIFAEYADPDDYVWLYGAPSALLHADPEGMRALLEQHSDGSQVPSLVFDLNHVNAMLVDTGRNALFFCDRFVDRFLPGNEAFQARVRASHRRFLGFILTHPDGRDDDALEAVREEIAKLEDS